MKPLGKKAYGSIPHLPGSKLGIGDHHCHEGQARICTEKTRDRHDVIIVQEKYDGSCVSIAKIMGEIVPLTRSGYVANTSPYKQHHIFHSWVLENYKRFDELLGEGERVCGEWMAQAHGLKYAIYIEPLVLFDLFSPKNERLTFREFHERVADDFLIPRWFYHSSKAVPIDAALSALFHEDEEVPIYCLEKPEGVVYRVERKGEVDFLAKFVRHDFEPGKYLPEISGNAEYWNWSENDPKPIR